MKLFDFLKSFVPSNKYRRVVGQGWQTSFYNQTNANVFDNETVYQCIRCITQEAKKLEPRHVIRVGGGYSACLDNIQTVLDNPNELMTTGDFIEKVVYNLLTTSNSFILPAWQGNTLTALYPLQPTNVEFIQDLNNEIFVKFSFLNGHQSLIKYSDVIHVRHNFGANEFMGGNVQGELDIKALQNAVNLNADLNKSIYNSIKTSGSTNGVVKVNTMLDQGKTEEEIKKLTERLNNNESGFMLLDLKSEFTPLNKEVKLVDKDTLSFADEKVLRFYGVSIPILTGDFTPEQYAAFYQKTIEPIVVELQQAFTKGIFTKREMTGFGHKIQFYYSLLGFMTNTDKIQAGRLLSDTGSAMVDEIRSLFGLPPCEDKDLGKTMIMSKNFGSAKSVKDMIDKEVDAIKSVNTNEQ